MRPRFEADAWSAVGEIPQPGHDVVMALAAKGRAQDALCGRTNLANPRFPVIDSALQALAEGGYAPSGAANTLRWVTVPQWTMTG